MQRHDDLLQLSSGHGAGFATVTEMAAGVSTDIGRSIPHARALPPRAGRDPAVSATRKRWEALLGPRTPAARDISADSEQGRIRLGKAIVDFALRSVAVAEHVRERMKRIAGELRTYATSESAEGLNSIKRDEPLRLLRLLFLNVDRHARVVVFCGAQAGVGCSAICTQLATLLADQTSGTVCLLHADRPSGAARNAPGRRTPKGIAEAVLYRGDARDGSAQLEHLWMMTAGAYSSDGHVHFASKSLRQCVKRLRDSFDFVLIDAPPLDTCTDAAKLGLLTDGVVMVIGANSTHREVACMAADLLRSAKAKLLAAVLSRSTPAVMLGIERQAH